MNPILLAQAPGLAAPADYAKFLEYGFKGLAALMLLFGLYLFLRAQAAGSAPIREHNLKVGSRFMCFALAFLIVTIFADRPAPPSKIKVGIAVPPLEERYHQEFGTVNIEGGQGENALPVVTAKLSPTWFTVKEDTYFTINLNDLFERIRSLQAIVAAVNKQSSKKNAESGLEMAQ